MEASRAHNPKVVGSNPTPATKEFGGTVEKTVPFLLLPIEFIY